jgi:hypothetical protein
MILLKAMMPKQPITKIFRWRWNSNDTFRMTKDDIIKNMVYTILARGTSSFIIIIYRLMIIIFIIKPGLFNIICHYKFKNKLIKYNNLLCFFICIIYKLEYMV